MRLVACMLAVAVSSASASFASPAIYSSFGPGDSFSNDGSAVIGGSDAFPGGFQSMANLFTVTGGDFQLGKIEVATVLEGGSNSLVVSLAANDGGLPGTVLESFPVSGLMTAHPGGILSMSSTTHPLLLDGLSYWVVVEAGATDTSAGWWESSPHVDGTVAWNDGSGWRSYNGGVEAFRVTAVPEPATAGLLALGGLAALIRRRRARGA